MASSSTPLNIIDDEEDEEFDWEAAVKEIDVACARTAAPSNCHSNSISSSKVEATRIREVSSKKATGFSSSSSSSSRQSTLDRFIGIARNSINNKNESEKRKPNFYSNGVCETSGNKVGNSNKCEEEEEDDTEGKISFIKIDPVAAKTWIYPVKYDHPLRDYQFNISRTALFSNTLVALPTGLGKTFIAAVVMYNYFRWFPEGKIVFAAPSRPLVLQQIEACHNIGGIPQEWAIDLTGQTNPTRRADHWKSKRVFFVTPQVLEKDINSGSCLVKHLVCLVIDEAHRATGNYAYCVAVRELMAFHLPLRILALTATPGSKQDTVQHIIDNLQISTLEYRDETDPDVKPYVQDRTIELIEVPMGKDATETNNLILEVIRPYAARLSAFGVFPHRDFQTLSPCDILNSRDQFRQRPPESLHQMKYGEIEGFFGVLVTLYHIRKLLSSHGIKPAFEMLEEKFKQRSFARLMSRNEGLLKAKLLMQQHISHGAPSPKLSKLLDVLITHFKRKGPQNSRVIIFSNFRGSVRDIMNALKNISEFVKATEFIGQNSAGKLLKGQSQKVQQAVLQKFRTGEYNVIVATSIGEEGLDIMEVDLVVCFDANISSLRMIQRMGRTGRKHQGRVVVLACEGSEVKGYKRKQANSKTIKKYMRNGGTTNFRFHSSPRMIPHCFKPEVQFLELSVEQFVPRVKKVKADADVEISAIRIKLTDSEKNLIAKYFKSTRENTWRPSLIAFPHFQAFPSRVQNVMHSARTGMLIDAMQLLQGQSFSKDGKPSTTQGEAFSGPHSKTEVVEQCIEDMKGELNPEASVSELKLLENTSKDNRERKVSQTDEKPEDVLAKEKNLAHSFLFISQLAFIDDLGRVQISSPPRLFFKQGSHSKNASPDRSKSQCLLKEDSARQASVKGNQEMTLQSKDTFAAQIRSNEDEEIVESKLMDSVSQQGKALVADERIIQPAVSEKSNEEESISDSPKAVEYRIPTLLADESVDDRGDIDLSPRLTSYMESGCVPESPVNAAGNPEVKVDESMVPEGLHSELVLKYSQQKSPVCEMRFYEIQSPGPNMDSIYPAFKCNSLPVKIQTPLTKLQDSSFNEDFQSNSQSKSESVDQKRKFKRLCKLGDLYNKNPPDCIKKKNGQTSNFKSFCAGASHVQIQHGRGKRQRIDDAKVFIEEEAEVSSDMISDDEEHELESNSFDDSFIDDRINPTAANTQAEGNRVDMMGVYRRSLLSQSPIQRMPNICSDFNPDSRNENTSTSGTAANHSQTPENALSESSAKEDAFHVSSDAMPSGSIDCQEHDDSKMEESRKRKLSLCQARYLPVQNLENKFLYHSETPPTGKCSNLAVEAEKENRDDFEDDEFYNDIDLDAVEEQASKLLGYGSVRPLRIPEPLNHLDVIGSPSFDLGI